MEIAVKTADHAMATGLVSAAVRLTRYWGLANAQAVIDRTRAQLRSPFVDQVAQEVLYLLPRARWLDDDRRWFTFGDLNGRLEVALDKIFSLTGRIKLGELITALAKGLRGVRHAPPPVVRRYLVEIGRCDIVAAAGGPVVRRPRAGGAHSPTRQESALIRVIAGAGGEIDLETLRRLAHAASLPRTTVNQLLSLSPLFLRTPHQGVRLVGDNRVATYA